MRACGQKSMRYGIRECEKYIPSSTSKTDTATQNFRHIDRHEFIHKRLPHPKLHKLFANGRQAMGLRAYPDRRDSVGVSITAVGGRASMLSLDAWQMRRIYS